MTQPNPQYCLGYIGPLGAVDGTFYKNLKEGVALLVEFMTRELLDPEYHFTFEQDHEDGKLFGGNFLNVSMVFQLHTNDPEIIHALSKAYKANVSTPTYIEAVADWIEGSRRWCEKWKDASCFAESIKTLQEQSTLLRAQYNLNAAAP